MARCVNTPHSLFEIESTTTKINWLCLLFDLLHIINVSVKEVSHRVPDGCVFETWGNPKHCDIRYGRAQLSNGLTLKKQAVATIYQCQKTQHKENFYLYHAQVVSLDITAILTVLFFKYEAFLHSFQNLHLNVKRQRIIQSSVCFVLFFFTLT